MPEVALCTKADFDQVRADHAAFWGSASNLPLHHPTLLYEFGNTAYVVREGDLVIAYLFGFLAQSSPTAYVHLVAVRGTHRRQGLGRLLYDHFLAYARARGCTEVKAITRPTNAGSLAFHKRLGMSASEVVRGYGGPGEDRVILTMKL